MDHLTFKNGAKLYMTSAPKTIKDAENLGLTCFSLNVSTIVVLLEDREIQRQYGSQSNLSNAYIDGTPIRVIYAPIKDYSIPADMKNFDALIYTIIGKLQKGENVFCHCRGGHGRSGVVVTSVLIKLGKDPTQAYEHINKIRSIIDTDEQFQFLFDYERYVKEHKND